MRIEVQPKPEQTFFKLKFNKGHLALSLAALTPEGKQNKIDFYTKSNKIDKVRFYLITHDTLEIQKLTLRRGVLLN